MQDEINFMPDDKIKREQKIIDYEDTVCSFPPERFAEMDEDLLWNV